MCEIVLPPTKPLTQAEITKAAITELEAGLGKRVASVEALMADLNNDVEPD